MAERVFAGILLLIAIGYGYRAFFVIRAPFQYDPLGPQSWPQLLAIVSALCCLALLARPDPPPRWGGVKTLRRLALMVAALILYAIAFQPLGFVISTTFFCTGLAWYLGAQPLPAIIFGVLFGVVSYYVCIEFLALNLPAGKILPL